MKIIKKDDKKLVFVGKMESEIANSIRRYINEIPTLAIDEIEIQKNDSPLYDETLAHRIGLVPISMEGVSGKKLPSMNLESNKKGSVYSGDIKGVAIVYDKIPLTTLGENKELSIKGTTNFGVGIEHSKYSPGILSYRNVAEITMDKNPGEEVKKFCSPEQVKEKGDKIVITDNKEKEVLDLCEGVCSLEGKKAEIEFNDELVLNLESFGQMKNVEDVFKKSIAELKKDLVKVSKQVGK